MTTITTVSLVAQRQVLQRQLQAQRQVTAQQLGPTQGVPGEYPRSMTMRFLVRRSPLLTRLGGEIATLLIGARFMKSMSAAMNLSGMTRPASTSS